jgi:CheY-like chemotaxis protein
MELSARITEIRASGAVVQISDGRVAWLPAREIYPDIKPHQDFRSRPKCAIGTELAVVELRGTGMGRPVVSHVRATDDPWNLVRTWEDGQINVMEVFASTRDGAIGLIRPGILARVQLPGGKSMLPPSWRDFDFPLPGDEVAGYLRRDWVKEGDRIVEVDFAGYVESHVSLKHALVELPATVPPSTPTQADGAEQTSLRRAGLTLVVDNDRQFLENLSRYMAYYGCQVRSSNSYEEAFKLLKESQEVFDLAILDVHLENAKDFLGLKLAHELVESQPNCRVVLISGDDLEGNSDELSGHL